jgi:hypothetical protein
MANSHYEKKWKYVSIGLMAVLAVGFSFPQAFAHVTSDMKHGVEHVIALLNAIKAKTDTLPSDPASNTVVNTRASQASVDALSSSTTSLKTLELRKDLPAGPYPHREGFVLRCDSTFVVYSFQIGAFGNEASDHFRTLDFIAVGASSVPIDSVDLGTGGEIVELITHAGTPLASGGGPDGILVGIEQDAGGTEPDNILGKVVFATASDAECELR